MNASFHETKVPHSTIRRSSFHKMNASYHAGDFWRQSLDGSATENTTPASVTSMSDSDDDDETLLRVLHIDGDDDDDNVSVASSEFCDIPINTSDGDGTVSYDTLLATKKRDQGMMDHAARTEPIWKDNKSKSSAEGAGAAAHHPHLQTFSRVAETVALGTLELVLLGAEEVAVAREKILIQRAKSETNKNEGGAAPMQKMRQSLGNLKRITSEKRASATNVVQSIAKTSSEKWAHRQQQQPQRQPSFNNNAPSVALKDRMRHFRQASASNIQAMKAAVAANSSLVVLAQPGDNNKNKPSRPASSEKKEAMRHVPRTIRTISTPGQAVPPCVQQQQRPKSSHNNNKVQKKATPSSPPAAAEEAKPHMLIEGEDCMDFFAKYYS